MSRENFDKLGEECGVFGIYDFDGNDVASTIYYGLFALHIEVRKAAELQFLIRMVQNVMSHLEKVWDYVMKCLHQIPFRH